jgi:hypothetical protein
LAIPIVLKRGAAFPCHGLPEVKATFFRVLSHLFPGASTPKVIEMRELLT